MAVDWIALCKKLTKDKPGMIWTVTEVSAIEGKRSASVTLTGTRSFSASAATDPTSFNVRASYTVLKSLADQNRHAYTQWLNAEDR